MRIAIPAATALALMACGQGGNNSTSKLEQRSDPTNRVASKSSGSGSSQGGTAEAESIDCSAASAVTGNGPDVLGVTIGMPAELALHKIACSNPTLRVEVSASGGFQVPPMPDGSRPRAAIIGNGRGEEIQAWLAGLPGDERVVAIRREVHFPQGERPLRDELMGQLNAKFGEFAFNPSMSNQAGSLRTADNQSIPLDNTNLRFECMPPINGSFGMLGHCGLSVGIQIDLDQGNRQLVRHLVVFMANGSYGMQQLRAYNDVATSADQARRQQETQDAQGRVPKI